MSKEFQYFSYLKLDSSVVISCTKTDGKWQVVIFEADIAQRLKIVPAHILAGDYFQALHDIVAVRQ